MSERAFTKLIEAERFWARSIKEALQNFVLNEHGCWIWDGYRNPAGYGMISFDGKQQLAHRAAWEFHYGKIPVNMKVCHACDTPPCINPGHLWLGTQTDNLAEAARDVDLFVAEAYFADKPIRWHLDMKTLLEKYPSTGARRLALTWGIEAVQTAAATIDLARTVLLDRGLVQPGAVVVFVTMDPDMTRADTNFVHVGRM